MNPAAFIHHLRRLGANPHNRGQVAILRRSLTAEPGVDVRAFPLVEKQLPSGAAWTRTAYYLVAGLWASVHTASVLATAAEADDEAELAEPEAPVGTASPTGGWEARQRRSLGQALAALYHQRNETPSIEQRFIALLDADEDQLPYRLRQAVQLLRAEEGLARTIDWVQLLDDLLHWNDDERRVQQRWARAFYRQVSADERAADESGTTEHEKGA